MIEVGEQLVRAVYKPRPFDSKKYDYGHLLVIGGSKRYTGAPLLVGMAAMRAGCDLATVVAPMRSADAIAAQSPSMVTWPLHGDVITPDHLPEIRKFMEDKTAAVVGNGMRREEITLQAIRQVIKELPFPAVIDADTIRAVGDHHIDLIRGKP